MFYLDVVVKAEGDQLALVLSKMVGTEEGLFGIRKLEQWVMRLRVILHAVRLHPFPDMTMIEQTARACCPKARDLLSDASC